MINTIPKKKKCKKAKWLSQEVWRKGKIYPFECRVPKNICKASAYNEGEIRKPSSVINAKK